MLNSSEFYDKIYSRFPQIYRDEDEKIGRPLYRYLKSLNSGFSSVIEDTNNLIKLIDIQKNTDMANNILDIIAKQYGITLIDGLDESFVRHFLSEIPKLLDSVGSKESLSYIVSTLTGFTPVITETPNSNNGVDMLVEVVHDIGIISTLPNEEKFAEFLSVFVPFYVNITVIYSTGSLITLGEFEEQGYIKATLYDVSPCILTTRDSLGTTTKLTSENTKSTLIEIDSSVFASGVSKVEITGKPFSENSYVYGMLESGHIVDASAVSLESCTLLSQEGEKIPWTVPVASLPYKERNPYFKKADKGEYYPYYKYYEYLFRRGYFKSLYIYGTVNLDLKKFTMKTPLILSSEEFITILDELKNGVNLSNIPLNFGYNDFDSSRILRRDYLNYKVGLFDEATVLPVPKSDSRYSNPELQFSKILRVLQKEGLLYSDDLAPITRLFTPTATIFDSDILQDENKNCIWLPYNYNDYKDTIKLKIYFSGSSS